MIGTVALIAALFSSYIVVGTVCTMKGMDIGAEKALRDAPIVTVGWQEMMEDRNRALNERNSALQLRFELQQRYDNLKRDNAKLADSADYQYLRAEHATASERALREQYNNLKRNAELLSDELMMHQLTPCSIYAEQR